MVISEMNPLLLELWREKHPQRLEQFALGQNVNSYHDREGKRSFAELLPAVGEVPGIRQARFPTSHPHYLCESPTVGHSDR
jgi:hypothetical protein